jgi:hypothetical protein
MCGLDRVKETKGTCFNGFTEAEIKPGMIGVKKQGNGRIQLAMHESSCTLVEIVFVLSGLFDALQDEILVSCPNPN